MAEQAFRTSAPSEPTFYSGSTGRLLGTATTLKEHTHMARLEGTGKDPLGRYNEGEIFDVPEFINLAESQQKNPDYQELIDKGWAKKVKPADDPGRTVTQIADSMVSGDGGLGNPEDAKVAAKIGKDALAIVHTGDPQAELDGDLKTEAIRESQVATNQAEPSARFLGDDKASEPGSEPVEQSEGGGDGLKSPGDSGTATQTARTGTSS